MPGAPRIPGNRLQAISFVKAEKGAYLWLYSCACGRQVILRKGNVDSGNTKSCGCFKAEKWHRMSKQPLYQSWRSMRNRCENENASDYSNYGGRGISYDPRWHDFIAFREDMGQSFNAFLAAHPGIRPTIDRLDVNGDYVLENCRWATPKEQGRNRRTSVLLEWNGESRCVPEWAEMYGIKAYNVTQRLGRGWSLEKALTTPVKRSPSVVALGNKQSL